MQVNSSWNFGALEEEQLKAGFERYYANFKLRPPLQNLVPMKASATPSVQPHPCP